MFVQALISQPAVEALDMGVLIPLAGLDQPQLDPLPIRPHRHRLVRELRAVVRADHLRLAPQRTDRIERARQVLTAHRVLHRHRDHLVRRVIDTVRHLSVRPVATRSNTKSIDHTSFASAGRSSG